MNAVSDKVKMGIALLAAAIVLAGIALLAVWQPAGDTASRTVVVQVHHVQHRVHVGAPAAKTAAATETGTTLSGDPKYLDRSVA
jgi:hypothetical protein